MATTTTDDVENRRRLHLSRRLDWRFLLPDPALGQVGYVGTATGTLLASLRMFSRAVDVLPATSLDEPQRMRYDVLVMKDASSASMRHGPALLKPGGWCYAEFDRRTIRRVRQLPELLQSAVAFADAARHAGLADVDVHWHWPTFDACTRIVSLDEPTAFSFVLTHGQGGRAALVKAAAGRLLMRSGLLGRTVPCLSVTGRAAEDAR